MLDCPNGTIGSPLAVAIELNAQNSIGRDVTVAVASAVLIIVASPGAERDRLREHRGGYRRPLHRTAGTTALRVQTTLTGANGQGDASRVNEWRGRVTLTAGAAQSVETADTMRVNLP